MTEKRFTSYYNGDEFLITPFLENGKPMTKQEVLNQLNESHEENQQLKEQIKIYEIFLDENDLDIEWDLYCTMDNCFTDENEEFDCKDCKYIRCNE